jgi:hypothetical protein
VDDLIDRFLPEYHFVERHRRTIRAAPVELLTAAKAVRGREARLVAPFFFLRGLPARILGGRADEAAIPRDRPMLDFFTPLAESAEEVVAGIVGRFWQLTDIEAPRIRSPEEFMAFADPTFGKGVINFKVAPVGDGTLLTTETRVLVADPVARARFARYWLVVKPGSTLIRRSVLAAVARRAERSPQS